MDGTGEGARVTANVLRCASVTESTGVAVTGAGGVAAAPLPAEDAEDSVASGHRHTE